MNREKYFQFIEEKINALAFKIESRGKLNLLDIHNHAEEFYLNFFNILYKFNLENLNTKLQNSAAIDLIDYQKKIVIQVSATCTKDKIESALSKNHIQNYKDYRFKFISISKDATKLRSQKFDNPFSIKFIPAEDIYDNRKILSDIKSLSTDDLRTICEFIKNELSEEQEPSIVRLDTNLATMIDFLSQEPWDDANKTTIENSFEIERKIDVNELVKSKDIIKEYSAYCTKVNEKYAEFDQLGLNKSNSVLASIRRTYMENTDLQNADEIFQKTITDIKTKVIESANCPNIPKDEIELCIDILVVDAFTRCKIFKNPDRL